MTSQHRDEIPEEEARAVWKRAAEIQADAEGRGAEGEALVPRTSEGFSLGQVIEAAEGAGIDPAAVRLAFAERYLPDTADARDGVAARLHRKVIGKDHVFDVARRFEAPPDRVLPALEDVLSRPTYTLMLEDRIGANPPLDGVSVYRIDDPSSFGSGSSFHGAMMVADARIFLVTARADGDGTVVRIRVPQFALGTNLAVTGGLAGILGAGGGYGGAAAGGVAAGILGTASVAVLAGPAVAGALVGGALGVAGFRGIHRWGTRKGRIALTRLLRAVELELEERA